MRAPRGCAVALAALATTLAVLAPAASAKPRQLPIETLSTRADMVTGGDVLVAVHVPDRVKLKHVSVSLNGTDVTDAFRPDADDPQRLVGLVDGLSVGQNLLTARAVGQAKSIGALEIENHPSSGPVFSGPQETPYICRTAEAGLGEPTDANCSAPTKVEYFYRSTGGAFKPLSDPASHPADLAQTTTRDGRKVDYVVRVESGTINRAIYRWAVLAAGGETGNGWSKRLSYQYGGGCGTGYHQGGLANGAVLDNAMLRRGYAVATASLNTFGVSCNDVLSAETTMMVKERVIEQLRERPIWTMGWGGSGGAIQQIMIASNYPGLLDGILPGATFQDNAIGEPIDCRLLRSYFGGPGASFTAAQRLAVMGFRNANACTAWDLAFANVIVADGGCDPALPVALRYNAITNPTGARCTLWDHNVNMFGRDPATGFARRTLDNVGVQYGLKPLQDGVITADQFLDLNEKVGGFDNDGKARAARAVADPLALRAAYRTGRTTQGAGGLPEVPIIDLRSYSDNTVDIHTYIHSYVVRERLRKANGNAYNQVMWRSAGAGAGVMQETAIGTMSDWLDAIAGDDSSLPQADKVVADKPAPAVDACWTTNGQQRINDPAEIGANGPCTQLFPPAATPRLRAGQPLGSLAMKCELRPVIDADYGSLTVAQKTRLHAVFPDGVCDYSRPGVEEQPLEGTWLTFGS